MSPTFSVVCTSCSARLDDGFEAFCRACGAMADVEYDLSRVRLRDSSDPYERFRDLLPVADARLLPTRTGFTPTIRARRLGEAIGLRRLYLKNETVLPTGTTKDRMAAVALPYLYERGVRGFATSSTGNSSTAYLHAISSLPEMTLYLFTASQFLDRVSGEKAAQVVHFVLREASFVQAFEAAREYAERHGLVAERGFFNPGRREGLKLAWLEAADQVEEPIDWYVQAVSSAMGVYGAWRGACQLYGLGASSRPPRLLCVQQDTCAPMVSAWNADSEVIRPQDIVAQPQGIAQAILRGNPSRAYPYVRQIVLESEGTFVAASEAEIRQARRMVEELEGIRSCFAAAAAIAGAAKLRQAGALPTNDVVLINLTGRDRPPASPPPAARWLTRSQEGWIPEQPVAA